MRAVIQARTTSTRLPNKVLMKIAGKPIIHHVIDACRQFDPIVAVPEGDRRLIDCIGSAAKVVEGPEHDVAARFSLAVKGLDYFIRVCADSPALDPKRLRQVAPHRKFAVVRTVGAHGQQVEMVNTEIWEYHRQFFDEFEREHVTPFLYTGGFDIKDIEVKGPDMVVDTMADYRKVKSYMEREIEGSGHRDGRGGPSREGVSGGGSGRNSVRQRPRKDRRIRRGDD